MSGPIGIYLPCALLTINRERKMHYHDRSDWLAPIRQMTKIQFQNAVRSGKYSAIEGPVTVEFRPVQAKGTLADTVAHAPVAKAMLDGAVDARMIPNDTPDIVICQSFYPPVKMKGMVEGMQMLLRPVG